jgi:serine/threonine protein kinase
MSLPSEKKRKIFDGRYEIISIVGRGADSVVYRARHITGATQEVAIKVLVNRGGETTLTDKLRKEALTLVSCRHKYVVRLDDFHSIKDLCYLSMEYAPLGDLIKYTENSGRKLAPHQVEIFLVQALEALDFVHATGVIHRDIKPENILVVSEKDIRLADFGLALLPGDDTELEELRNAVGTFDYLAPEVLDGVRYDALSDLYSLGVCFYEVATGVHPFRNVPLAQQQDIRRDGAIKPLAELAPDVAPHIAGIISTLLRFSSKDRFQSAADALRASRDPSFRAEASAATRAASAGTQSGHIQAPHSSANRTTGLPSPTVSGPAPIETQGSAARQIGEPHVSDPSQDSNPANDDVVAARSPQPTEKIDLERVKSIIAKDSQQRSTNELTASSGYPGATSRTTPSTTQSEIEAMLRTRPGSRSSPSRLATQRSAKSSFSGPSTLARSASVALASTVVTIGALLAWNALSSKPSNRGSVAATEQAPSQASDQDKQVPPSTETIESSEDQILGLSPGFYSGAIRGLLSGRDIPLAFIRDPLLGSPVLILGIEGWLPTRDSAPNKSNEKNVATFRSNGLILQFNREMSSDKITGTVLDVVTGETGVWSVEKTS